MAGAVVLRTSRTRLAAAFIAALVATAPLLLASAGPAWAATAVTTTPSATSVTTGTPISDTATVTGAGNVAGSFEFRLFSNATCAGAPVFTDTKATIGSGNGSARTSAAYTPTTAGTYQWVVIYTNANPADTATSPCGAETVTVTSTLATTTLTTLASANVTIGGTVTDTATLAGGTNPTGTITFNLYGPNDATCASAPVFTSTVPVSGNGNYNSASFTPTAVGTYRWRATYSGDANNTPAGPGACADPNEDVVVGQATPTLTTLASANVTIGGSITDTASLVGGLNPTGTITFNLYGPNNATCTGAPVFTSTVPVSGNGNYTSGSFTPTAVGTYQWVASYSGDSNNASAGPGACADPNEDVVVSQPSPTLVTQASGAITLGGFVTDTATLAGGVNPTGSITFSLFGPNDATCGGGAVFISTVPVAGNGNYTSAPFTPAAAGVYRWVAVYSGDVNNPVVTSPCNAPNESVTVTAVPVPPAPALTVMALTTQASPSVPLGLGITDAATLVGGQSPTGTLIFSVFGPDDAACTGTPVFTSAPVAVTGNGTYQSASFSPTQPGTYRWAVAYSGDASHAPRFSPCDAPNESVLVILATPTLTTQATPTVTIGNAISDTATLTGGFTPTGTITFRAFGPDDGTCTGTPAFTSSPVAVTGAGTYSSGSFTPTTAGTYRWTATYSGDANNTSVAGPCNAANESVVVAKASPTLTQNASADVSLGGAVSDTATLANGFNPTGTITFSLYRVSGLQPAAVIRPRALPRNHVPCGTQVFSSVVSVNGNGSYSSGPFVPTVAGDYVWNAAYSGDVNNHPAETACGDLNGRVTVVAVAAPTPPVVVPPGVGPAPAPGAPLPGAPTPNAPGSGTPPAARPGELPRTGSPVGAALQVAVALLLSGTGALTYGGRPRGRHRHHGHRRRSAIVRLTRALITPRGAYATV